MSCFQRLRGGKVVEQSLDVRVVRLACRSIGLYIFPPIFSMRPNECAHASLIADECPAPPPARTPDPAGRTTQEREGVIGADAGVNLVQLNVYGD
jgi:hypothetical protein